MDQIAQSADVARATVFNYFPRKTEFLLEWTARRRERASAAVREYDLVGRPLDRVLHRYMIEMAKISEETREETRALLSATLQQTNFMAHPPLADELADLIKNASKRDESRGVDFAVAGLMFAMGYFAILSQWIENDIGFDLESELIAVVDIVLHGIDPLPRS